MTSNRIIRVIDELKLMIIPYVDDETEIKLQDICYWNSIRSYIRMNIIEQIKYKFWSISILKIRKSFVTTTYRQRLYDWNCENIPISILRELGSKYRHDFYKFETIYDYIEMFLSEIHKYKKYFTIKISILQLNSTKIYLDTINMYNHTYNYKPDVALSEDESIKIERDWQGVCKIITDYLSINKINKIGYHNSHLHETRSVGFQFHLNDATPTEFNEIYDNIKKRIVQFNKDS
jgi:hypothetical protein